MVEHGGSNGATRFRRRAQPRLEPGADHPDTLVARAETADWRGKTGDLSGALRALEEVLVDRVRVLGPDDPVVLATRNDLALWQAFAGDPLSAVRAFEELLTDQRRVLGADHRSTLVTRHLRVLGADHPTTVTSRTALASARGMAGDPAGARVAFEELLQEHVRTFGSDDPRTLDLRSAFILFHKRNGDVAGAITAMERPPPRPAAGVGPRPPDDPRDAGGCRPLAGGDG